MAAFIRLQFWRRQKTGTTYYFRLSPSLEIRGSVQLGIYHNGYWCAQDYSEAMRLYQLSQEQGNCAMNDIGALENGSGVRQDNRKALLV